MICFAGLGHPAACYNKIILFYHIFQPLYLFRQGKREHFLLFARERVRFSVCSPKFRAEYRNGSVISIMNISHEDVDDFMIHRFLRARDLDIEKASALFLKYLSWRKEFVPNGSISPSEIPNELDHNKLFMQGHDKLGRPIVVVFGGRHKPKSLEEFKRFVTFSLDKICARMPSGQEKFVCIGDLEGWGYTNSDVRGYIAALSILQDCYPERLGKLFIVHVPYIFMTAWKVVYPFIDSKTKKKIIFVEDKKLESTLLRDIDENQLPETYGGKLPLVPIQDC